MGGDTGPPCITVVCRGSYCLRAYALNPEVRAHLASQSCACAVGFRAYALNPEARGPTLHHSRVAWPASHG